eukprot:3160794-Pyramimonas_sp.AAC.1
MVAVTRFTPIGHPTQAVDGSRHMFQSTWQPTTNNGQVAVTCSTPIGNPPRTVDRTKRCRCEVKYRRQASTIRTLLNNDGSSLSRIPYCSSFSLSLEERLIGRIRPINLSSKCSPVRLKPP